MCERSEGHRVYFGLRSSDTTSIANDVALSFRNLSGEGGARTMITQIRRGVRWTLREHVSDKLHSRAALLLYRKAADTQASKKKSLENKRSLENT